jgi:xanthine dehydrogenase molybdopterin-binding subunit B
MVVEGQIHGGLTQGLAPAMYEEITFDEDGNIRGSNFQDYLIPTSMETPSGRPIKRLHLRRITRLGPKVLVNHRQSALHRQLSMLLLMHCN